jgi:hypothetical protein
MYNGKSKQDYIENTANTSKHYYIVIQLDHRSKGKGKPNA